ncbi:hypothetical protein DOX71_20700 [Cronobacter sakazakii]|nr:hypothetical protein [Cronobacter sakazakii]
MTYEITCIIHLYFLIGTRNRLSVAISWVWNHSVAYRGARIITGAKSPVPGTPPASSHTEGGSAGYHRAQLQQSVSGHTNAFFDGLSDRAVRHTRYRHKRWPY